MQGKGKIKTVGKMLSTSLIFFTFNPLSPIPNSTRVIIHVLDAEDFHGHGTNLRGRNMLQEICDFIIDPGIVKAPMEEFGASDLDPDSR